MFLGSYLSGLVPLAFSLSESKMRYVTVLGAGLLVGTALAIIVPEGVHALYINELETNQLQPQQEFYRKGRHLNALPAAEDGHGHKHHHLPVHIKDQQQIPAVKEEQHAKGELPPSHQHTADAGRDLGVSALKHTDTAHSAIGITLILGFVFMLIVDNFSSRLFRHHSPQILDSSGSTIASKPKSTWTATLGLVVHAAADGIALGAASSTSRFNVEIIVFMAIMLHKAPAAFGLVSFLIADGVDRKRIRRHLLIFSLAAPLTAIFTYVLLKSMADIYIVERVLDKRIIDDQVHYYLKWFGFGDDGKYDECVETITNILNKTESTALAKSLNDSETEHVTKSKSAFSTLSIDKNKQTPFSSISTTTDKQSNISETSDLSDFESLLLAIKIDENRSQQQLPPSIITTGEDEKINRIPLDDTHYSFIGAARRETKDDDNDNKDDVKFITNSSDDDHEMSSDSQKTIEYQINQRSDDENIMEEEEENDLKKQSENTETSTTDYLQEQTVQMKSNEKQINNFNEISSTVVKDEIDQMISTNETSAFSSNEDENEKAQFNKECDQNMMNDGQIGIDQQQLVEDRGSSLVPKKQSRKHRMTRNDDWQQAKRHRLDDESQASPSSKANGDGSLVDENGNDLVKDNKMNVQHSSPKTSKMSQEQQLSDIMDTTQSTSKTANFDFLSLEPEEIVCITRSKSAELQFLLKCKKCPDKLFYITNKQATEIIPQLVIQFYERHIDWFNINKKSTTTTTTTRRSTTLPLSSNKHHDYDYRKPQQVNTRLQTRKIQQSNKTKRSLSISYDTERRQPQQRKSSAELSTLSHGHHIQAEQQQLRVKTTGRNTTNGKTNTPFKKRHTKGNRSTMKTLFRSVALQHICYRCMSRLKVFEHAKQINDPHKIRNVGIIAHIDAGKTTTVERMLYYTGVIRQMGNVDDGNTTMDYMEQERERGITITSAAITFPWNKHRINLIDTPGHVDFTIEVERSLRVLDGAVTILDSSAGVETQSLTVWRQANNYQLPRIIYLNKLDKPTSNLKLCLESIEQKFNVKPLLLHVPIGHGKQFRGIVDLIHEQFYDSSSVFKTPATENSKSLDKNSEEYITILNERMKLIEQIADNDDSIAELLLTNKNITSDQLKQAIKRLTLSSAKVVPVLCGSSLKNIGIKPVLDSIIDYLPSAFERSSRLLQLNGTIGYIFKTIHDKQKQPLSFARIYAGQLKKRMTLINLRNNEKESIQKVYLPFADDMQDLDEIQAGSIAVISGLKATVSGDILVSSKALSTQLIDLKQNSVNAAFIPDPGLEAPTPVFFCTIETFSDSSQRILDEALIHIQREDPSLRVRLDEQTGQTLLLGMGELHIDIIRDRLKREYKLETYLGPLNVNYRETPTIQCKRTTEWNSSLNERKASISITMSISPVVKTDRNVITFKHIQIVRTEEQQFENLKKEYIEAIEHGTKMALTTGCLIGADVVDTHVKLHDLQITGNVSPALYSAAASDCIRACLKEAECILLQPVMRLEVRIIVD
ncbi:unnamed protein product [Didymodactylos carnosus]|uniref:Uncharacterized protein n=1 Tax=Didymodactylos carnosus TaxID=1234261 RepID=A0A814BMH0_9BILA|nr:unnamed protein product [Didymodactylos carnosus]CAF0931856.1 unnamed protein product [Didymodactylos carnosus]CAF3520624.1 unnamed protein product [Didymodactylos carnosus]CAF3709712.1 unnamed protein product [Didymodactylos carnosus]